MAPDKTIELRLRPNEGGRTDATRKRLLIDLTEFCHTCGAYVIRFDTRRIPRLVGESTILKIGETTDGFFNRFSNYNHQNWLTCAQITLSQALLRGATQVTNAYLMFMLPRLRELDRIFIDFYFVSGDRTTDALQEGLLSAYLDAHLEAPPLNLGKR
jgi:hypothetical protein